jgi:molybdopterin/thiamine biosynthesis adenylyltransferase
MSVLSLINTTSHFNQTQPMPAGDRLPTLTAVDLGGAPVAVLGCGSVGGFAAWSLAGAGVTRLELADRDRLEPANCRRHVGSAADLGWPKAAVVASFLRARYPQLTPVTHDFCFLERPDRLRELLARCDLALAAVDDEAPKHLIDAMARELGRPVVYAGVYGGGWAVEAVLIDPAAGGPCYACTARTLGRAGVIVDRPEGNPDYAWLEPGRLAADWVQADLTSILPCAALASRLAIAWLARQRGAGAAWEEFHGASAWRLALRAVPSWGLGPWELRPVAVERQPGCPNCGPSIDPAADLNEILEV